MKHVAVLIALAVACSFTACSEGEGGGAGSGTGGADTTTPQADKVYTSQSSTAELMEGPDSDDERTRQFCATKLSMRISVKESAECNAARQGPGRCH